MPYLAMSGFGDGRAAAISEITYFGDSRRVRAALPEDALLILGIETLGGTAARMLELTHGLLTGRSVEAQLSVSGHPRGSSCWTGPVGAWPRRIGQNLGASCLFADQQTWRTDSLRTG